MSNYWNNGRENTAVDIRVNGPGNPWQILDLEASVGATSGGQQGVESDWRRSAYGGSEYIGGRKTGNPARVTYNLMTRITASNFIRGLLRESNRRPGDCERNGYVDIRVRQRCGDQRDLTSYTEAISLLDSTTTGTSTDNNLANNSEGDDLKLMTQEAMSAGLRGKLKKLVRSDISASVTAQAINAVAYRFGSEWWIATDGIASPASLPEVLYSTDDGATWSTANTNTTISAATAGDNCTSLIIVGGYLVAATDSGVCYARINDVKNDVASAWTLAAEANSWSDFPTALHSTDNGTIWGAGASGHIFRSTGGPFAFEIADDAGATSNDLVSITSTNDDLVWFGGASGTLVRYRRGVFATVAVASVSDELSVVRAPYGRNDELIVGTDGGEVWATRDANASTPTFIERTFDGSGAGSITDIQFAGWNGDVMFVIQTNVSSQSRVLRDLSGGALGGDVEIIGTYTDPINAGINQIAIANQNTLMAVGEPSGGQGYIEFVTY
jgi:hypothetical protein